MDFRIKRLFTVVLTYGEGLASSSSDLFAADEHRFKQQQRAGRGVRWRRGAPVALAVFHPKQAIWDNHHGVPRGGLCIATCSPGVGNPSMCKYQITRSTVAKMTES